FLVSDILNLPPDFINSNKFDAVVSIAVLNHIPSKELRELAIKNIFNLLKPNGYFLMTNWNLWNISFKKSWWKLKYPALSNGSIFSQSPRGDCGGAKEKLDFKGIITYWGQKKLPLYYHGFTKREIKKLLEKNNFKVIENFYNLKNKKTKCWKAENLVTAAQKINA
ncbi:MAG: class I SAM-dependent methyltransferase, partial [bacterium]